MLCVTISHLRVKTRMQQRAARAPKATPHDEPALLSLGDHLRELQGRLFSTVFVFIIGAAVAYPFFAVITEWLMAPLREGQELVYLTPGGAFSFIIKVCAYVGLIATLPIIIYHIYRFIMPAVQEVRLRKVLAYTVASLVLAVCGILFAYYVSLPAALYFLTGFELNHINPMLTIDAYFSFVMTYMIAGAILFQVPLLMLIINSVTPLTPSKLMTGQRYIIVGSFIIAAIISPTPDALNQTLLAAPVIVMYQLGIIMIWRINARARRRALLALRKPATEDILPEDLEVATLLEAAPTQSATGESAKTPAKVLAKTLATEQQQPVHQVRPTMSEIIRPRSMQVPARTPVAVQPQQRSVRSMDIIAPRRPAMSRADAS